MKKILFAGAYGIDSYGDDASMLALTKAIKSKNKEINFKVIARHHHEQKYNQYGIKSIEGLEYEDKISSQGKWLKGFNPEDSGKPIYKLFKEIESADLLIVGAGNFLVDYSIDILKGPVPIFLILTLMAKMAGTQIFWFGISVGPLNTRLGKKMSFLSGILGDKLTVRDHDSQRILKDLGIFKDVIVLPDPVLGLKRDTKSDTKRPNSFLEAHSQAKKVICVSLRALPSGARLSNEDFFNILAKTFDKLIQEYNYNLLFIPQCVYEKGEFLADDRNVNSAVISKIHNSQSCFQITEKLSVYDQIDLYSNATASICTRLHGSVFSIMKGIPTIGLNYNKKVKEFYEWCNLPDFALDLESLEPNKIIVSLNIAIEQRNKFRLLKKRIEGEGEDIIDKYATLALGS